MDLQDIMFLGNFCEYLKLMKHFPQMVSVKGEGWLLDYFRNFHSILKKEKIAAHALDKISHWINKLDKEYPKEDMRLKKQDALDIRKAADKWRDIIEEDLRGIHVLRMDLQSGLNPEELRKLANKLPSELIMLETWKKLTDIEKNDFSDAAKCLLLGTATPSVMVALRGAEASIRNYYHSKTAMDPENRTWRQITAELKSKAGDLGIEENFIGYLDYFGDAKRNLAQHPNRIFSLREAVITFMQVVGLIEDIYAPI